MLSIVLMLVVLYVYVDGISRNGKIYRNNLEMFVHSQFELAFQAFHAVSKILLYFILVVLPVQSLSCVLCVDNTFWHICFNFFTSAE